MKKSTFVFFILGMFFLLSIYIFAVETGEIKGSIQDEQGEMIPGIEITADSSSLQGIRTVISLKKGNFHFPLLPVGKYNLTFKLAGFSTYIQKDVVVHLGKVTNLRIKMELSKLSEEVTVYAAAPLIDKTSTDTSYHLNSEKLEKIPVQNRTVVDAVKFTPGAAGVRVNTRRGTSTEGQPSFRGEGEEGNNWIVDGLCISGVRLRNSGMRLNFDSIDEIQIISDPFSPEYGSAYGAVINMVTKSGSNDLSGEFSLVFMDKNLQSSRQEQLSIVRAPDYFSNYDWYFNLGGPLIKDKLWFFISNNLFTDTWQTRDTTIDYFSIPGGNKSVQANNLFTKLSYAIVSGHTLSITSIFHQSLRQKGGTGVPELFEEKDFSDLIFRLNYKGIINSSTFVEAGLGHIKRDQLQKPIDNNLGPAMYYIEDLARNIHNSYGSIIDDQTRLDFSFKLIKHFDTDTFGHHELNFGFEYFDFSSQFGVDFSGEDEDLFPENGFDAGTKYYFDTWEEGKKTPTFFYEYGVFDFINTSRGIGLYFKDKVTWNRVTFMAGFRSQTQQCLDNKSEKLFSWGISDFISPRLSMAIDLTGDGKNIVKLGWGRFSDLITTMPLGLLNSGAGLTFRTYRWQGQEDPTEGQLHFPSNWAFENEQKNQPFEIASGLKPNFLTRYLIEFDRRIGKNWVFKARYIRTKAKDLLEVLAVFDVDTGYKFLYDNFKYKRRDYSGFEFELNGQIGPGFFLNASYSHALARGTNPGQTETGSWAQEEGNTNYLGLFGNHIYIPDFPELAETKAYYDWALGGLGGRGIGDEGWYGKLPYSIDHNFKLLTVFAAPYGVTVSAAFEYISGYYWEKLGYVPFFGGYYSFPETRGTRSTPSHFFLDLGAEKEFILAGLGLPQSTALTVRADIFNLFNSQKPVSYVKEDIPIFGQVWGRQQPRQVRISIKFKW